MDLSALESAIGDREFTIVSVGSDLPVVVGELQHQPNVHVWQPDTTEAVADLVAGGTVDLLIVEEAEDDWDDVRELLRGVREAAVEGQGAPSIIVRGSGMHAVGHLRALLAGAHSYAPRGAVEWSFENVLAESERPVAKLREQLDGTLRRYDVDGRTMIQTMRELARESDVGVDLENLIGTAANRLSVEYQPEVTDATAASVRDLLQETAATGASDSVATAEPSDAAKPGDETQPIETQPGETQPGEAEFELFWTVLFPDHPEVLNREPHTVAVGAEYPFESRLEPTAAPGGLSEGVLGDELVGKQVQFMLVGTNGEFQLAMGKPWRAAVVSVPADCSETGVPAFAVRYRATTVGPARIEASLLADGGAVAMHELDLVSKSSTPAAATSARAPSLAIPVAAIAEPAGADYLLSLDSEKALLREGVDDPRTAELPRELPLRVTAASVAAINQLQQLKCLPGKGLALVGAEDVLVPLARIGSDLHRTLFCEVPKADEPNALLEIADRLRNAGSVKNPARLQVSASTYAVPWGVLYDGPPPADGATAKDIEPGHFWGMRFDVSRPMNPTSKLGPRRGERCVLKPIVGKDVPSADQQLEYFEALKTRSVGALEVGSLLRTPDEVRAWAGTEDDNDLLYLFCHAMPKDSELGFGRKEKVGPNLALDELKESWARQRKSNPVVILNGCASGQNLPGEGTPFVHLFAGIWGAQAFIGTDWSVIAGLADQVGQRLVTEIVEERQTLRAALRSVIRAGAEVGNYFPLMYAVYGPNNVEFTAALARASP
jgi:hypothetical protein